MLTGLNHLYQDFPGSGLPRSLIFSFDSWLLLHSRTSDRPVSLVGEVVLPTSKLFCILALWAFKQPASIWVARKSNGNNPVPIQYMTGKSFRSSTRCLLSSATFQHHVMSTRQLVYQISPTWESGHFNFSHLEKTFSNISDLTKPSNRAAIIWGEIPQQVKPISVDLTP